MGLVVSPRHKIIHLVKNDRNPCLKSHSRCAGQFKLNVCRMIFAKRQLLKLLIISSNGQSVSQKSFWRRELSVPSI